jgi:hypothetical protein
VFGVFGEAKVNKDTFHLFSKIACHLQREACALVDNLTWLN